MTEFFKNFPTIEYSNSVCKDILSRIKINDDIKKNLYTYYSYSIKEGERVEHIAYNYYDAPEFDWLIYLANDIIDPVYDVNLSDRNFNSFVAKKYGSILAAQRKILFYKNDWISDNSILTPAAYEALATNQKKYWNPIINEISIFNYERKSEDWTASTNKIQYSTATVTGTFTFEERIVDDANSSNYATIMYSNTSQITFKHVVGEVSNGASFTGETSGATAAIANTTTLKQVIPDEEVVYYSPVTAYEYESEKNVQNKEISIIDKTHVENISKQMRQALK